jgi:RNA polymerase sigma-70 factor, ECF subfamily
VSRSSQLRACDDLLRRYAAPLKRLAWSYEQDSSARDDLLQEIALALWTALPHFRGDASERTWVYRVAHNTAISFVTSRKRRSREQPGEPPHEPASTANPERAAIEQQRREQLWSAVQDLPLADRQVVVLHLEGLSAAEIEAVTGLTAGAIATRLTRIRQKLAASIRGSERHQEARS